MYKDYIFIVLIHVFLKNKNPKCSVLIISKNYLQKYKIIGHTCASMLYLLPLINFLLQVINCNRIMYNHTNVCVYMQYFLRYCYIMLIACLND